MAAQGNRWAILEHFKRYFAGACGSTANRSSSESWAESDLNNLIWQAADNAPLFVEAFYEGCEALRGDNFTLPEVSCINRILADHQAGFEIRLPAIVAAGIHKPIPVPERYQSLDEQAQDLVQQSFRDSERLLSEGHPRQAVQEILWLMESVLTPSRALVPGKPRSKRSISTGSPSSSGRR
ncbi:hypothetical protein [Rhizobium bangladeshense]|uniref:hypothetical protein n=1 Tax=Rhizobium bangladeshense TaxID=1138189 RepID=UPI0012E792AC|nr:hypothetical protein [Rhizobium bangladeshense]